MWHSIGDRCDNEYYYAKTKYCSIHSTQLSKKKKHLISPDGEVCIKCKKWKALPYNFLKNSKECNLCASGENKKKGRVKKISKMKVWKRVYKNVFKSKCILCNHSDINVWIHEVCHI